MGLWGFIPNLNNILIGYELTTLLKESQRDSRASLDMRILIVEDLKSFNNALSEKMKTHGFEVHQAYGIEEALCKLQGMKFDFLFLDLILPDGMGEDLLERYKFDNQTLVVVFTADNDIQRRESLFANGILDYISKLNPFEYICSEAIDIIDSVKTNQELHILVIDDSSFVRKVISKVFRIRGFNVHEAASGSNALELLKTQHVDLILCDLEMPQMSGEKVISKIRSQSVYAKVPIIVLSGTGDKEKISRIMKHGADEFIKKPFSIEDLVLRVKIFLKLSHSRLELERLNKQMEEQVVKEVEKRREQERIMMQQSRHAAMGEMVGNIAHQWRQPLNSLGLIVGKLELAFEYNRLDETMMQESVKKANRLIEVMSRTIDDFRNFFMPQKEKEKFLLEKVIADTTYLLQNTLERSNIQLRYRQDDDIALYGYGNELAQVLMVILTNAKDAIEDSKTKPGVISIAAYKSVNEAIITISDNGPGVSEEIQGRIFDPYFTTKSEKKGTGIGLYMAKKIIENSMDGTLNVTSDSHGACFKIVLPIKMAS